MTGQHQPFLGKTIAIGICGGIAAYRVCDLVREFYRRGAEKVVCLFTESAETFISPMTLSALSHQPAYRHDAAVDDYGYPIHIKIAQEADLFLIVPATVNTIAKLAQGFADNLLATTFMAFTDKPVVIAPAMNTRMWNNPIFQSNLSRLSTLPNVSIVPPTESTLACGEVGNGHLASEESILQQVYKRLHPHTQLLNGLSITITAGGTSENIDPVRCISNHSSGKMGLALADEAWAMGATVTLLTSKPVSERDYTIIPFQNTQSLQAALEACWPNTDWLLMAAAVSDFIPAEPSLLKIKKDSNQTSPLNITLLPNIDLLEALGKQKQPHQRLIGFAAESHDMLTHAQQKMTRKNLDAIIANDISRADIGFQSDENEVTVLFKDGQQHAISKAPKPTIAQNILTKLHGVFLY